MGAQVDVLAEPAGWQASVNASAGRDAGSERVHADKARGYRQPESASSLPLLTKQAEQLAGRARLT